jgi:SAM-dependent methyltransferase
MTLSKDQARIARMTGMTVSRDNHHYIVLRILNQWIKNVGARYATGVLLDYGCGGQPYKSYLLQFLESYIGADVAAAQGTSLDIQFDPDQPLPLTSQSVDTILSTQTLEHVRNPAQYLQECARLLRPGGYLLISVPMQWRLHEVPHDYWRFTKYGLQELLAQHGFEMVEISICGGAWALAGQIINSHLAETGRGAKLLFRCLNEFFTHMDRMLPDSDETIGWMCVARSQPSEKFRPGKPGPPTCPSA